MSFSSLKHFKTPAAIAFVVMFTVSMLLFNSLCQWVTITHSYARDVSLQALWLSLTMTAVYAFPLYYSVRKGSYWNVYGLCLLCLISLYFFNQSYGSPDKASELFGLRNLILIGQCFIPALLVVSAILIKVLKYIYVFERRLYYVIAAAFSLALGQVCFVLGFIIGLFLYVHPELNLVH